MKTDKDIMWTVECEPEDKRKARGIDTLNWLWKRKETEIALVAHGGSLLNMMNQNEDVQIDENLGKKFDNCELRSMKLYSLGKGKFKLVKK